MMLHHWLITPPAVTHETVRHEFHNVVEEAVTREIHHHDIYHRVQPVTHVEVLPARHFLQTASGPVEVPASQVPRSGDWHVAVDSSARQPGDGQLQGRRFTAREFSGTEGDAESFVSADGVWRTRQTWVHPPTVATGGRDTGQTVPFEFK